MKRVLVTGFEPFMGKTTNRSQVALEGARDLEYVTTHTLPVEFGKAGLEAAALAQDGEFDSILLLGEAPSLRPSIGFERAAYNRNIAALIPDNAGRRQFGSKNDMDGPARLLATMDYSLLETDLAELDLHTRQQAKMGRFVCNDLFYSVLNAQRTSLIKPDVQIGFAHIGTKTPDAKAQEAVRNIAHTLRGDIY